MSVICYKETENKIQVAFDGRCILNGDEIETENFIKAYKLSDNVIIGATGVADTIKMLKRFVENKLIKFKTIRETTEAIMLMKEFKDFMIEEYGVSEKMIGDFGGILIANRDYHGVFYYDDELAPYPTKEYKSLFAYGSTGIYTSALLDTGMSFEEAIKLSAKKYTSINDNVTILEIEK